MPRFLNKKALIIDDDEVQRTLLSRVLKYSFITEAAGSSDEAILKVYTFKPDVLTLDIMMPGLSGADLLSTIRAWQPQLPVVMVSGVVDPKTKEKCFNRGAFSFIEKPFDRSALLETLGKAVSERDGRDEKIQTNFTESDLMEIEFVMHHLAKQGLLTNEEALNEIRKRREQL